MQPDTAVDPQAARFAEPGLFRCPHCRGALGAHASEPALICQGCGFQPRIDDEVLVLKSTSESNNLIAQTFYDSPLWPRFRFWEYVTWFCNGGERRARSKILRHLPQTPGVNLLDVAIGDGAYLPWLPRDWRIVGVDISMSQLQGCRPRAAGRHVWLVQAEAEQLPFDDHTFDAVLSIGAFNYFNDPEGSLREMVRVARPGAAIVVSDEIPNLTDRLPGRKLGLPGVDRFIVSRLMHLGDDFTAMVERRRDLDILAIGRRVLPDCRLESVWLGGVGYVLVGRTPGP
jgi:SAM-dependent methyltransferase